MEKPRNRQSIARPRSWYDYGADWSRPQQETITIEEYGPSIIDTGLLDANGDRIIRTERREPIGFIHPKGE